MMYVTNLSLKVIVTLTNIADPGEMQHYAAFHLGLHCLPKYPFRGFRYTQMISIFYNYNAMIASSDYLVIL